MRTAIVHDYFCNLGGSDAVARALHDLYPDAPVYTLLVYKRNRDAELLKGLDLRTSFLQKLPFADRTHQPFLPLMPLAVERLDLRGFDLVLSSSHTVAKGVIPPPGALHICYCHTPMRYAWDLEHAYLAELPVLVRPFAAVTLHRIRQWDVTASTRVDYFIANSHFVAERIWKYYRREAAVIPPPVDTNFYTPSDEARADYYLLAGRLTGYKRADLAVEAFRRMSKRLVVVGDGPERKQLERRAGPTVNFVGHVSREELREYYRKCRALIFPGIEDFGIVPLEAQACGAPVIALNAGGARDTVIPDRTGLFFETQTVDELCQTVSRFETMRFNPQTLREHALYFSSENFLARMRDFIVEHFLTMDEMRMGAGTTQ